MNSFKNPNGRHVVSFIILSTFISFGCAKLVDDSDSSIIYSPTWAVGNTCDSYAVSLVNDVVLTRLVGALLSQMLGMHISRPGTTISGVLALRTVFIFNIHSQVCSSFYSFCHTF